MSDVFDSLVGQDRAVAALRLFARQPVHAYLFVGPAGANVADAVRVFAAALQCPEHGCGRCEACRRVLEGVDPDVHVAERSGVSWRVDDLREMDRISRRRPLGAGHQIMIVPDVELTVSGTAPSAPALLKSLEEPPTRTIFLLSAEEVPEELTTIVSRCVEVRLVAIGPEDLEEVLRRDGVSSEVAAVAARSAGGDLARARLLVRDPGLGERLAAWRSVPERLTGTASGATSLAAELAARRDAVVVDDAIQGVTDVVRGLDLKPSTSVHRLLQSLLDLPAPRYRHHRLVLGPDGRKLSKSAGSPSLRDLRAAGMSAEDVRAAALN